MCVVIRPVRREIAVRNDNAARFKIAEPRACVLQFVENVRAGARGKRLCVAHQRAQVGVLPFLDTAGRQASLGEALERGITQWRSTGQLRLGGGPFGRELLLGRVLDEGDLSHPYSAAIGASWNCA